MSGTPSIQDLVMSLRSTGMTQQEIETETGISQTTISRWESGNVSARSERVLRLLQLVRVRCPETPVHA